MINAEGNIVLIDFGLATFYVGEDTLILPNIPSETIVGTPKYMSIRLFEGNRYTARDDLISLGYIYAKFYLGGQTPWEPAEMVKKETDSSYNYLHIHHPLNISRKEHRTMDMFKKWLQDKREILDYFGKDLMYTAKNGGSFFVTKNKKIKCDLVVIRINRDDKICKSRPCYNCLSMMKGVGIRKVYYTDNKQNIICENVKDMISINASSVTKMIDCLRMDLKMSHDDFFENLLKTLFPNKIKKIQIGAMPEDEEYEAISAAAGGSRKRRSIKPNKSRKTKSRKTRKSRKTKSRKTKTKSRRH
jgi:serine/threonine protein kinase